MNFTFPTTPLKQKSSQPDFQPSSCLKNNGNVQLRESADGHKHSVSQVRFSLPAGSDEYYEHQQQQHRPGSNTEETFSDVASSPTKVVYPRSSDQNSTSHFVDFQHKVMVDVPEHIWQAHYNNRKNGSGSSSPTRTHERTQSLQSVIADTLQTYHTKFTNEEPGLLKDTNLPQLPPSALYLRSDSPLNKFKVAVPLEASLPPYLSPENKFKRRNSLVYDGQGYSTFLGDPSDEDSILVSPEADQSSSQYSDFSIPSATHDYSFDAKEDVDQLLGIDSDANVSLKKQARNLLNKSPIPNRTKLPSLPDPPSLVTAKEHKTIENTRENAAPSHHEVASDSQSEALKILGSPSKTITIPSFDHTPSPSSRGSISQFLTKMDDSLSFQDLNRPDGPSEGKMNTNFQFPSPSKASNTGTKPLSTSDADDTKSKPLLTFDAHDTISKPLGTSDANKESSPLATSDAHNSDDLSNFEEDNSFERRRKLLRQQSDGSNFRRHTHSRTRSIHGTEDLVNGLHSQHYSQSSQAIGAMLPERSPRRSTPTAKTSKHGSFFSTTTSTPTKTLSKPGSQSTTALPQPLATIPAHPSSNLSPKTSFTNSSNDYGKVEKSSFTTETEESRSPTRDDLQASEENWSRSKRSAALATEFFESQTESQELDTSVQSLSFSEISIPQEEADADKSLEITGERFIGKATPLSTYNSFKAPLDFPPVSSSATAIEFKSGLAPSRQLSNNASHSSYESRESIPSRPSTSTAYSQEGAGSLFNQISSKKANSFVTKRFSNKNPSPARGLAESKELRTRTFKDYIGNKWVDVILLDDSDEDIASPSRSRPRSFHEDALKHYSEILDLCDKTADKAKGVILDLVNMPAISNTGRTKDVAHLNVWHHDGNQSSDYITQYQLRTENHHPNSENGSPSRYVSNLDRLRNLGIKR
ncbi:Fir1p LALA0_S06e07338g [Lachancea lanzarotensis]|uniref:LALA0S06e07338g1_1 n=1 Tax=Lachancea lanzarotensis TaxID=1245769 RepID=A0A0C7N4Q9_9SACH|nr:uncharacterized protein LALA0_S06e07338g [Lachancea lanzarotensis]CEP62937.1 LALA0S06e07338g1_1 [Lachancea lanzarotensis]